ncbi:MAG: sugar transporter family protein [Proteobacteria bacterium]|nr:sugar transporter family protein [Pseudomonadota bacterium]
MRTLSSRQAQVKRAAWASWIGSALEYYDFFLYSTAAALILGPLYFPRAEPGLANLAAVASIGAGYLARPFGALLLGYLGDRYGRRLVLCLTLLLMGLSTFAIGVLPTYREIGIAAPLLLVALRLLQGLAVSGEHAGANALVLELAESRQRGLYTSFALSGTQAGIILSSVVFMLLSALLSENELLTWGWRIPFLGSALLVVMGVWVRFSLPESPVFLAQRRSNESRVEPLEILWRQYRFDVLRVLLAAQVSVVPAIVAVFSLSWAVGQQQIARTTMLAVLLASAGVGMLAIPLWAHLSDRIGRRSVFVFGALASGVLIWPYLWAIAQASVALLFVFGVLLAGVAYSAANGVWPSLYGEMFSTRVRLSGVAVGTQFGFTLAAQAPTLALYLTRQTPAEWNPVACLVSVGCALSAVAVLCSRETSRLGMTDLGHPPDAANAQRVRHEP